MTFCFIIYLDKILMWNWKDGNSLEIHVLDYSKTFRTKPQLFFSAISDFQQISSSDKYEAYVHFIWNGGKLGNRPTLFFLFSGGYDDTDYCRMSTTVFNQSFVDNEHILSRMKSPDIFPDGNQSLYMASVKLPFQLTKANLSTLKNKNK